MRRAFGDIVKSYDRRIAREGGSEIRGTKHDSERARGRSRLKSDRYWRNYPAYETNVNRQFGRRLMLLRQAARRQNDRVSPPSVRRSVPYPGYRNSC